MEATATGKEVAVKPRHKRKESIDEYCSFLLEQETKTNRNITHLFVRSTTTGTPEPNSLTSSK